MCLRWPNHEIFNHEYFQLVQYTLMLQCIDQVLAHPTQCIANTGCMPSYYVTSYRNCHSSSQKYAYKLEDIPVIQP